MDTKRAREIYADIIDLPHHQSATRKHMSLYDRAAQFAPFAALSGFDAMVNEEARLTDSRIELSESEIDMINGVITEISAIIENGGHPAVTAVYFKPDLYKDGGKYERLTGVLKRVDPLEKKLIFYGAEDIEDKRVPAIDIPIESVIELSMQVRS
ncbi:MAG: hypothetical protein IJV48_08585 [Ruminococcus sp.]|nr:hypothetical protein [Ruminococcus sp.]